VISEPAGERVTGSLHTGCGVRLGLQWRWRDTTGVSPHRTGSDECSGLEDVARDHTDTTIVSFDDVRGYE